MKAVSTALVAVSFAASFVGAWDTYAPKFDTPGNTDCSCSSQQQQGFDWSGLNNGPVSSFGGFGLTGGLSCQSNGKRDGAGGKCVVGSCGKSSGPGFSCPANQEKFSISQMHVSSEFDTDVECHYTMPDNSKCVETHSCSKSGSVITPSQCGGAKSMSIVLPSAHPSSSCSFSISSVGFHCGSATVTPFPSTSYHAKTTSTPVTSSEVKSSSHSVYTSEAKSTPTSSAAAKTPSTYVKPSSSPVYTPSSSSKVESSSSKAESTTTPSGYKPTSSAAGVTTSSSTESKSSESKSSESKATESTSAPATVYTSEVVITTTTSCSAGHEITSVVTSPTVSTIIQTSTETITSCAASVTDCPARKTPVTSIHTMTTTSSCSVGQTIKTTLTAPTVLTTTYKSTQAITTSAVPSSTPAAVSSSPSSSAAAVSTTVSKVYTVITTCSAGETVTPTSGMPYILPSPSVITSVQTSYGSAPVSSAPVSSAPASSSAAGVSTPASSAPAIVTSVTTSVTSTTCPPGYTVTPAGSKPTTLTAPSVSSYVVTQTNTYTSAGTVPNAPASTPAAPTVLPRCLNSFQAQGCTDNTDSSCYCKDATYITNAINCAVAHGESPSDVSSAISYLQGICAPQIPQNPAIVTAVPSTVTVVPVASPTSISAGVTQCPNTVITYKTTVSGSAINTVITAPQVSFASASSGAALVPATTTAAAVATSAPAAGAPASYAPAPAAASSTAAAASTFVPSYASTPAAYTPTSTPATYQGAATKQTVGGAAAGIVGLAAFMLL